MRFGNPSRDRETKPGSWLPGARLVRPVEALENKGQIFLRYTDTSILNLSDGIVAVCVKSNENAPSRRRVLHCIVDQDQEQATERLCVTIHQDRNIGDFAVELNLLRQSERQARH